MRHIFKKKIIINKNFFLILFLPFFLSSCSKNNIKKNHTQNQQSIFIEMPQNKLVFENLSSLVYESINSNFLRLGIKLTGDKKNSFYLRTLIENLDTDYKFLSPDLLTYTEKIRIDLNCQLFDSNDKLLNEKKFSFSTFISKPKDYSDNSSFLDFEYRKLLDRDSYRIARYFKKFL